MKSIWTKSLIASGILLSGSVYGAEGSDSGIVVRPYATTGFQLYELRFDSEDSVESNYLYFGFGATVLMDRIYVDVNYSTSLEAEFEEESLDGDLDRSDFSAAVGYLLPNGFAVFGGYTNGNTDYDYNAGYTAEFEAGGLFGGGSYQWSVNDRIQLNVHDALAFLNGTFNTSPVGSIDPINSDADTIGGSFGFSASTTLTDNLSLSGFIKMQSYTYDNFDDLDFNVDETLTTLGVKVGMVL